MIKKTMIVPVILCGGAGVRLWPLSRKSLPKQHLKLFDNESLLFNTMSRAQDLSPKSAPILVSGESTRFLIQEEINKFSDSRQNWTHIVEPSSRNTAPAIALACLEAIKTSGPDAVVLVMPSDHLIKDQASFNTAIEQGLKAVELGKIVTFGLKPKWPETGYGYIQSGKSLDKNVFNIEAFKEKPDFETAEHYLKESNYFWNCGIFLMKAKVYLEELKTYNCSLYESVHKAYLSRTENLNFLKFEESLYDQCESISIDYCIMEKTINASVVVADYEWSDVGSWSSVWKNLPKDKSSNVIIGHIEQQDCENCLLIGTDKHLSVVVGLKDICYLQTADTTLMLTKDKSDNLKTYINNILNKKPELSPLFDDHKTVYRPWGFYETLDEGPNYKIKRIRVKPGGKLSLQSHNHRAEHWVVIQGVASVTVGSKEIDLIKNQSTFISQNEVHRLENKKDGSLEIIEIQTGDYLGEDDITRYEDIYGRSKPL